MNEVLEAIIYISAADPHINQQDIDDILNKSKHNNPLMGITGALLYNGKLFVQILEGATEKLNMTLDKLNTDGRHGSIIILAREPIENRHFASWSMAYRELDGLDATELQKQFGWEKAMKRLLGVAPEEMSLSSLCAKIASFLDQPQS